MSCCCSIDLVFPGTLLERFIIGPDIGPERPIPGCPGPATGLPLDLGIPHSPGPEMGGRCGIPIPLPIPPEQHTHININIEYLIKNVVLRKQTSPCCILYGTQVLLESHAV